MKSAEKIDVLTIGEVNVDLIFTGLKALPQLGQEILAQDMDMTIGGSTVLFALAANKLGLRVNFISKVGDDNFGHLLLNALKEQGLNISNIKIDKTIKTGITLSLSFQKDRGFVTYPGSIAALTINDLDLQCLQQARHLHFSSYFLQENLKDNCLQLFQEAKSLGLTTSFDTGYDPKNLWNENIPKILKYTDVFLPNQVEALNISQKPEIDQALTVLNQYAKVVVIKLGREGACAKSGDEIVKAPGFKVEIVDTTGAGDCFNAGFIYGYLNGFTLQDSLRFANACGALSVTKMGGVGGIAERKQVEYFLSLKGN